MALAPADPVDLAEAVAVDLVDEDDGRNVVALRVEGFGRGIDDALKLHSRQRGIGAVGQAALGFRRRLDRARQDRGFDPASLIDPLMPSAFLARVRAIAGAGVTGRAGRNRGGLTRRPIRVRDILVNSVD